MNGHHRDPQQGPSTPLLIAFGASVAIGGTLAFLLVSGRTRPARVVLRGGYERTSPVLSVGPWKASPSAAFDAWNKTDWARLFVDHPEARSVTIEELDPIRGASTVNGGAIYFFQTLRGARLDRGLPE